MIVTAYYSNIHFIITYGPLLKIILLPTITITHTRSTPVQQHFKPNLYPIATTSTIHASTRTSTMNYVKDKVNQATENFQGKTKEAAAKEDKGELTVDVWSTDGRPFFHVYKFANSTFRGPQEQ